MSDNKVANKFPISANKFSLKVPVGSNYARAVGRNGAVDLGAIQLDLVGPTVSLGFVTAKRQLLLHGGATFDGEAMDQIAIQWLRARGWLINEAAQFGDRP